MPRDSAIWRGTPIPRGAPMPIPREMLPPIPPPPIPTPPARPPPPPENAPRCCAKPSVVKDKLVSARTPAKASTDFRIDSFSTRWAHLEHYLHQTAHRRELTSSFCRVSRSISDE